jgi:NADPH-dependent 2,4-dienoyl-CoA reductase/sulfur reductase-like enzyme
MISRKCVVIGGGPAGLAAAIRLRSLGIRDLELVERNASLGGVLNQCIHPGFGISYYDAELTGPEYAARMTAEFMRMRIPVSLDASVLGITDGNVISLATKKDGYREMHAEAIIVATGCRERTRENLGVAGTRPAGVFMAGQAQNLVNLGGYRIGRKVLIQGSGDIGLIMARRLSIEGYEVVGVLERLPYLSGLIRNKVQCLDSFRVPLMLRTQVCEIVGDGRISGVYFERIDDAQSPIPGTRQFLECDTLLFSVGLIPEVEVLRSAGIRAAEGSGPAVNSGFETAIKGVFACGNCLHIHDLADSASREAERAADSAASFLSEPTVYRAKVTDEQPFVRGETDTAYGEAFFRRLEEEQREVCVLCPKGCILPDGACPRGLAHFNRDSQGMRVPMTTMANIFDGERKVRVSLRSESSIDIDLVPIIRASLRDGLELSDGSVSIELEGRRYNFKITGYV